MKFEFNLLHGSLFLNGTPEIALEENARLVHHEGNLKGETVDTSFLDVDQRKVCTIMHCYITFPT